MPEEVRVDATGFGVFFNAAAGSTNGTLIGPIPVSEEPYVAVEVWVPPSGSITVLVAPAVAFDDGTVASPQAAPAAGTTMTLTNHGVDILRYPIPLAGGLGLYVVGTVSGAVQARYL